MEVKSPITGGATTFVSSIPVAHIIQLYKKYTDVARFFTGLEEVKIYECTDTGYKFYQPFSTAGDSAFYEDLSREPLYYIPWKNEHTVASEYVKTGDKVFEQGCANGDFLIALQEQKQIVPYGSEINDAAVEIATKRGVSFATITDADVVCSFQVLEHIADVKQFINEAIQAAKTGGYIMFAVPNNDTFMKDDSLGFLNMPPHHLGIWTAEVFKTLPNYFPLELVTIHEEKLQPVHYHYYYQRKFGNHLLHLGLVGKVLNKIIFNLIAKPLIHYRAPHVTGHTLTAVFKKV